MLIWAIGITFDKSIGPRWPHLALAFFPLSAAGERSTLIGRHSDRQSPRVLPRDMPGISRQLEVVMAKGQKKTNREAKKPKAVKAPVTAAVTVSTLMSKGTLTPPKGKK